MNVAAPESSPRVQVRARLLFVDDDELLLRSYVRALASEGYDVVAHTDGEAAIAALKERPFDVIFSDIDMPRMGGLALLERIRAHDLDVPVILVTGCPTLDTAMAAIQHGAHRYLPKPVETEQLRSVAADAIRLHKLARAKRRALDLAGDDERLVGDHAGLVGSFGRALETMWMAYQPIVSWSRRDVFGFEALLRSKEPSLPHPGAILDAAERLDRLQDLGRVIRARASQPVASMRDGAKLFVNLHTRDLLDEELYDRDSPLALVAHRVVLEITERASLHDIRDVQQRVAKLREMGFSLAIDDLGAGYAGLNSFSQLEPEVVKLDMSLIRDCHKEPKKLTLVRTMIAMCHELGILVVAEGIENAEERDAIVWAGCDLLQGYLFAKPGPAFPAIVW